MIKIKEFQLPASTLYPNGEIATAVVNVDPLTGLAAASAPAGASTSTDEYYRVTTNFTDGAINLVVGDELKRTTVYDPTGAITSDTWIVTTQGNIQLSTAPNQAFITFLSIRPLTLTQLQNEYPLPVNVINSEGIAVIDSDSAGVVNNPVTGGKGNLFTYEQDGSTSPPTAIYYVFGTTTVGTPVGSVYPFTTDVGEVLISNGRDVAQGSTTDAAYTVGAGTVVSILKGIFGKFASLVGATQLPANLGQSTMAGSLSVAVASDQSEIPVVASPLKASGVTSVSGTFSSTGASASFTPIAGRDFNVLLKYNAADASVNLERSLDAGANWAPLTGSGVDIMRFTDSANEQWGDSEVGVRYRLNCVSLTAGTVDYQISQ